MIGSGILLDKNNGGWPSLPLLMLLLGLMVMVRQSTCSIEGSTVHCSQEGAEVSLANYTYGKLTDDPCVRCRCLNGTIVCIKDTCDPVDTCPVLQWTDPSDRCCKQRCQPCSYAGQLFKNDDHWQSSQDSCRTLTCKGGVVTMSRMKCVATCQHPQRMVGFCCPLCPKTSDMIPTEIAQLYTPSIDPCVKCRCDNFSCHCYRTACPALDCMYLKTVYRPGQCCPECLIKREKIQLSNGRCVFKNRGYEHEQKFRPDPCTLCKCQDGSVLCRRFVCPAINCPKERLFYDKGLCCPRCRNREPLPCNYTGTTHKHGASWSVDSCTTCKCRNGQTRCSTASCPVRSCPPRHRLKHVKDQCCPVCEEVESTCTVENDSHFSTFDGRNYTFRGTCRYVLTKQCIIDQYGSTPDFIIVTKLVPIRNSTEFVRQLHIRLPVKKLKISLLKGPRARENGRTLNLKRPYVKLGVYSLMRDRKTGHIVLRVYSVGMKIVWDRAAFVEISASAKYQGRLCGLCGNFNHEVSDDFRDQTGFPVTSKHQFAQSWRHGSWKKCDSDRDRTYHRQLTKLRRKLRRQEEKRLKADSLTVWKSIQKSTRTEGRKKGATNFSSKELAAWNRQLWDHGAAASSPLPSQRVPPTQGVPLENGGTSSYPPEGLRKLSSRVNVSDFATSTGRGISSAWRNATGEDLGSTDIAGSADPLLLNYSTASDLRSRDHEGSPGGPSVVDSALSSEGSTRSAGGSTLKVASANLTQWTSRSAESATVDPMNVDPADPKTSTTMNKKHLRRRRLRKLCEGGADKWKKRKTAIKQCRLMKSSLFAKCRTKVKPNRFFRWCIADACACPASGRCFCESLDAYADKCAKRNVRVQWKQHSLCQEDFRCPMQDAIFSNCAPDSSCVNTCSHPNRTSECNKTCIPGCACPNGFVVHENACIPRSTCPA